MSEEDDPNLDFIMPFGEHKGKQIGDVPIDYLKHINDTFTDVRGILKEVLETYEEEIDEAGDWFVPPTLRGAIV